MVGAPLGYLALGLVAALVACGGSSASSGNDRIDPMLLDYVAPIEGDSWQAANGHYDVGIAQVRQEALTECMKRKGFPPDESILVEAARFDARAVGSLLPALDLISRKGVSRTEPAELRSRRESISSICPSVDTPRAAKWVGVSTKLRQKFLAIVEETVDLAESESAWSRAEACMTDAGAPPRPTEMPDGTKITTSRADMYVVWVQSVEVKAFFDQHRPDGGSPESQAFARCMRPFFDEVERLLEAPREEFVEKHREELVELQRQFASFDVAED